MQPLLHSKQAEHLLGLRPGTLATWRSKGTPNQPPYITLGVKAIRYQPEVIEDFLTSRTIGGAA